MKHQNLLIRKVGNLKRKGRKCKRKRSPNQKNQQQNVKKRNLKVKVNKRKMMHCLSPQLMLQQIS